MMQDFIKIITSTGIYFAGSVLSKMIGFFMLPVITHYVSPNTYGFYDLTITYLTISVAVLFLEIGVTTLRFLLDFQSTDEKYQLINNTWVLFLISFCLYTLVFGITACFVSIPHLPTLFALGLSNILVNIYYAIVRGFGKNKVFVFSGLAGAAVQAGSNILGLVFLHMDYSCLYWATLAGNLVQLIILEHYTGILSHLSLRYINFTQTKRMVLFALPLMLNSISFWFCSGYNRTVIAHTLGDSANGLYATAGKFGLFITMAGSCFALAWQEMSYKKTSEKNKNLFFQSAFSFYLQGILAAYIILVPLIYIIFPTLTAPAYHGALSLIPLYILWIVFDMIADFMGNIITGLKKTKEIFFTTLMGGLTNILFVHLLTPICGLTGSNIALIVGFAVTCWLRKEMLHKELNMKIPWKVILPILPFVACIASGINNHYNAGLILAIMVGVAGIYLHKTLWTITQRIIATIQNR